jgi:3-oxoacyl-[acyl-carrier-protein] synthase III
MYISGIAYRHGDLQSIRKVAAAPAIYEQLVSSELGLGSYSIVTGDILELAAQSVASSLETSGLSASDIDAVIISSCTFTTEASPWSRVDQFCRDTKLTHATPYSIGLGQCSSFHYALKCASGLVRSGECSNVVVVVADKANERDLFRVNEDPEFPFVGSDMAASCIVSRADRGGFRLASKVFQNFDATLVSEVPARDRVSRMVARMEELFRDFYRGAELERESVTQFIGNNYSSRGIDLFEFLSGLPRSKIYCSNIPRLAHGFGADNLINLKCYAEQSQLAQERVVLFGSGTYQWSVVLLESSVRASGKGAYDVR